MKTQVKLQKLWYLLLNQTAFLPILNNSTLFVDNEKGFYFPGTEDRKSIMEEMAETSKVNDFFSNLSLEIPNVHE